MLPWKNDAWGAKVLRVRTESSTRLEDSMWLQAVSGLLNECL